ncbi:hypothetical protein AQUSIP_12970 [Aquicella siphonis]|uniref:Uncharacterized protein n=1 Tax=Aquicella siphonis TaxID=254247 RepID=A0A5E4PI34_9COXI|nr:hypothetical protein [Aquicella siphonis]VVC75996.1 hypothetical protein AQUSIP_12970 [Aquicella siphonis]
MATNNAINTSTNQFLQIANDLNDVNNAVTAFNNISPLTTKGDLIGFDGSDNVRVAVGTNDYYLAADSTAAAGFSWKILPTSLLPWTVVSGTTQAAAVNNGYIANNAGLVTITLPSTAAVGSVFHIVGLGAGGWKLAQNASQLINFGSVVTTTGTSGYLQSTDVSDSVYLVCVVANTTFKVLSAIGNITYV